jgi:hypothetical protein
MAMTSCRECSKPVAADAPTCPACGVTQPGEGGAERDQAKRLAAEKVKRQTNIGCGAIVLGIIALTALFSVLGGDEVDEPATADRFSAEVACEDFVERRLRAPSTADYTGVAATGGGNSWTVSGSVDSENGFGAKIRSRFGCRMTYDPQAEQWTLLELTGLQ